MRRSTIEAVIGEAENEEAVRKATRAYNDARRSGKSGTRRSRREEAAKLRKEVKRARET